MSKSRIVLRLFLAAMLIGLVIVGYYQWAKSRPDFYFHRAEAAMEREDFEAARINLAKLLQKHPDNAEGHELLSQVILQEARANQWPTGYAGQPAAAMHLARAAELRPQDEELQRRLLRAFLQMRYFAKAAVVAEDIYRRDKTNGDAHFALTWRAVKAKDTGEAERLFAESAGVVSQNVFQELALKILFYDDLKDGPKLQSAFQDAAQTAANFSPENLRLLSRRDREVMIQVLLMCQSKSNQPEVKIDISRVLTELCENLAKDNLLDDQLLGKYSSQSQAMLSQELHGARLNERQRWLRDQLADQAGELGKMAMQSSGGASPAIVYWTTARGLLSQGKPDEALAIVENGISAWERARAGDAAGDDKIPGSELSGVEPIDVEQPLSEDLLELHHLAARLLMEGRRFSEAQAHLEWLKGDEKYEGWGHLLRGNMLLHDGRLEDARDGLIRARRTLDDQIQVETALARTYLGLEEWELAIPYLQSLLVDESQLSDDEKAWRKSMLGFDQRVHLDLLRARLALDQWKQAQESLTVLRDTELAPQAWNQAITYLWERQQRKKAWDYLRRCRELFPDDVDFVFLEARFHSEEGQRPAAERVFEDFVAGSPNDPVRRLAQARWLIRDGNSDNALRILNTLQRNGILNEKARNSLNILQVQALILAKREDEAATQANELIAQPATGAAGYLLKAVMAWQKGDKALGAELMAKARAAEPHESSSTQKIMRVTTPEGEVVGVEIHDAYYW